jgi:hypothetical protein
VLEGATQGSASVAEGCTEADADALEMALGLTVSAGAAQATPRISIRTVAAGFIMRAETDQGPAVVTRLPSKRKVRSLT